MTRDEEELMLNRCTAIAFGTPLEPRDQREANFFFLAALVTQSHYPLESSRIMEVTKRYFEHHPDEQVDAQQVLENGWVIGLPRLRTRLERKISRAR